MAKNIKGNHDGAKGGNDTYNIVGRGTNIPRKTIVQEIKQGKHPEHTVTKIDGKEYAKAKPNSSEKDNVN
ncbi:MAG: DUF3892 domain-containing protein [Sulfuricurvum sp.]|uniref:DUF3892 domain-containing protein n=1 Tax=Sulfuricurvum sp. TaxID=2025608 RepID=UPI0027243D5A|nr:DUF3892 domain-containing protein [Sulfuricurvum sp.]MDO9056403.1 DUF3892 domain-containing protein [Sulfuricurvum sp.]